MSGNTNACGGTGEGESVGVCEGNLVKQLAVLLHKEAFSKCANFLYLTLLYVWKNISFTGPDCRTSVFQTRSGISMVSPNFSEHRRKSQHSEGVEKDLGC